MEHQFYKKQVFQHWDNIELQTKKRFPKEALAGEASMYVLDKLADKNWLRIQKYDGRSKFSTYLYSVTRNLLEDFSKKKFGTFTPPKWLEKNGTLWVTLYKLLCREKTPPDEAAAVVSSGLPPTESSTNIEQVITIIQEKIPNCGEKRGETVDLDPADLEKKQADTLPPILVPPDETHAIREQFQTAQIIFHILTTGELPPAVESLRTRIQKFDSLVTLSDEEYLLLKMVYQDEVSVSQAGRLLGWETNKVHGRHRRLLEKLKNALDSTGLEEELRDWLKGGCDFDMDFDCPE